MSRRAILLPFLLLPLIEIAGFILVGDALGVLPTVGLVVASSLAGAFLLRREGLAVLRRARVDLDAGRAPTTALLEGAVVAVAGVLLMLPGFLTDIAGLALFVPPIRNRVVAALRRGFGARVRAAAGRPAVLDLDGAEFRRRPDAASPWRDRLG